jgi:hypothetical protein
MKNNHCRTWNMARKLKTWKMRNAKCRASNLAKNNEKRGK